MQHVLFVVRTLLNISKSLLHVYPCISIYVLCHRWWIHTATEPFAPRHTGFFFLKKYTVIYLMCSFVFVFSSACEVSLLALQNSSSSACSFLSHFSHRKHKNAHTHIHICSFSASNLVCLLVHSELLDVPVFFPQDGNLVPEQHRVQPHLGVHQRHETQPVTEDVHAGLSLGKMVRVSPPRCLGTLGLEGEIDIEG